MLIMFSALIFSKWLIEITKLTDGKERREMKLRCFYVHAGQEQECQRLAANRGKSRNTRVLIVALYCHTDSFICETDVIL